jgi:transcription initiation factor TFIIA small subunit
LGIFLFLKGKLSTYRFCDNVWTLVLKDFVVKDSGQGQHNTAAPPAQIPRADKVKIVACDGKSM